MKIKDVVCLRYVTENNVEWVYHVSVPYLYQESPVTITAIEKLFPDIPSVSSERRLFSKFEMELQTILNKTKPAGLEDFELHTDDGAVVIKLAPSYTFFSAEDTKKITTDWAKKAFFDAYKKVMDELNEDLKMELNNEDSTTSKLYVYLPIPVTTYKLQADWGKHYGLFWVDFPDIEKFEVEIKKTGKGKSVMYEAFLSDDGFGWLWLQGLKGREIAYRITPVKAKTPLSALEKLYDKIMDVADFVNKKLKLGELLTEDPIIITKSGKVVIEDVIQFGINRVNRPSQALALMEFDKRLADLIRKHNKNKEAIPFSWQEIYSIVTRLMKEYNIIDKFVTDQPDPDTIEERYYKFKEKLAEIFDKKYGKPEIRELSTIQGSQ